MSSRDMSTAVSEAAASGASAALPPAAVVLPPGLAWSGMLVVDKPAGCTSHDVVVAVRRRLKVRTGHTGTLDPQATGVLLICLGRSTRLARFLQEEDKQYLCSVRFGWATDTYDGDGEPVGDRVPVPPFDRGEVARVLSQFVGELDQVPPVYSAKKIRGQPAYRRARRGETVVHDPVRVVVHAIDLLNLDSERLQLRVRCGAGTYVRTLAHEIGLALGCPSHLESLRRERAGGFGLDHAIAWKDLLETEPELLRERLVRPAEMLPAWPRAVVRPEGLKLLRNGGVLEPRHLVQRVQMRKGAGGTAADGNWFAVVNPSGEMVATAQFLPGGLLQPRVVLI